MSTTFLQQILSGKLLLVVIVGQKSNLSVSLKFKPIRAFSSGVLNAKYLAFGTPKIAPHEMC